MVEEWRPVVGYEGLYEISNLGRVKSVERDVTYTRTEKNGKTHQVKQHVKEHIVKQGRRIDGYADVPLSKQGVTTLHCVHRLIAEAWIPNPNHEGYVNHKDLDKTNNDISNLEWMSNADNVTHGVQRYSNPQSVAVYCKETDQVYASMGQCDRALGLSLGQTSDILQGVKSSNYTLTVATDAQIAEAQSNINAKCSWAFHLEKKGRLHSIRKLKCIDTQQIFDTLIQAAESTGLQAEAIRNSIRAKRSCKGYTFYYLDDSPADEAQYLSEAQQNQKE